MKKIRFFDIFLTGMVIAVIYFWSDIMNYVKPWFIQEHLVVEHYRCDPVDSHARELSGRVTNASDKSLQDLKVIFQYFYRIQGRQLQVINEFTLPEPLSPGDSRNFSLRVEPPEHPSGHCKLGFAARSHLGLNFHVER